ncbi:antibiotic biosynthesis monooxygenase family protein [Reichenbachiella versicolor]|uniref:antibiotic biosynthesis monooxygenase family protein n=1 Tax=Reichenbachiella versicolor TaxID=1821036 RepID=UPI0013A54304|nr:antibiotic biosynthesis monooxygenase [Reichenbachiella versicolor]
MNEQVLELVVYKIKKDQIKNFQQELLQHMRDLMKNMEGMIEYKTFSSVSEDGVFVDQVRWEDLECAELASAKVKLLEKEEPFASIFGSFEEVKFFQHLKKVA